MNKRSDSNLREFYEKEYERGDGITSAPQDGNFMYSQVLRQIRHCLEPGMRILDLGCHTGPLSLYMANTGCDVTGIDLAKNAVETAIRSAEHWNMHRVRFMQMDFLEDWQDAETFDFVLCNHVVEHVPDDEAFVKKIHFATKPGGRLLLMAPTTYSSLYRVHKAIAGKFAWDEEVGHLRRYNRKTFTELVEKAGYQVEKIEFFDSVLREWAIVYKPLRWTLRIFGRKYIRNVFNSVDKMFAHFLFPATICIHARRC